MSNYTVAVVVEKDDDGYFASCPSLQGCYTQGDTYEEVIRNLRDAIVLHIQDRAQHGEPLHLPEMVSVVALQVAA